jgi:hypothetical protein
MRTVIPILPWWLGLPLALIAWIAFAIWVIVLAVVEFVRMLVTLVVMFIQRRQQDGRVPQGPTDSSD